MKITLSPEEIVKLCLWDSYVYYVLGSDKEAKEILEKNEAIEISQRDALVIGLLKVIETDNLAHKFNNYVVELLTNKSTKKTELMIRKKVFDMAIDKFLNKFPEYWTPDSQWSLALEELNSYVDSFREKIKNLEVHEILDGNIIIEMYSSNSIKKLLKFNY